MSVMCNTCKHKFVGVFGMLKFNSHIENSLRCRNAKAKEVD